MCPPPLAARVSTSSKSQQTKVIDRSPPMIVEPGDGRQFVTDPDKLPSRYAMMVEGRCLEPVIEHVADHDHAALRPLPHTAELGMIELRLTTAASRERRQQLSDGIAADAVTSGDIGNDLPTLFAAGGIEENELLAEPPVAS